MFRKSTLTLGLVVALTACALAPNVGSALAEEVQGPSPATATLTVEGQPKGKVLLRSVIEELSLGKSEFAQMEPTLRVNVMQQKGLVPSLAVRLQSIGVLQSISYAGSEKGLEIYDVRFADASMAWAITVGSDGRLARLMWKFR